MPRLNLVSAPEQTPHVPGYGLLPGVMLHCQHPNPYRCPGCLKDVARRLAEQMHYDLRAAEERGIAGYMVAEGWDFSATKASILKQYTEEICRADHADGYDVLSWVQHSDVASEEPLIDRDDLPRRPDFTWALVVVVFVVALTLALYIRVHGWAIDDSGRFVGGAR